MPHMESASIGLWAGVGGRHEPLALSGMSHFVEHLLFKGTKKRNARKITEAVEGVGGYLNASRPRTTCYYAKACVASARPVATCSPTCTSIRSSLPPRLSASARSSARKSGCTRIIPPTTCRSCFRRRCGTSTRWGARSRAPSSRCQTSSVRNWLCSSPSNTTGARPLSPAVGSGCRLRRCRGAA